MHHTQVAITWANWFSRKNIRISLLQFWWWLKQAGFRSTKEFACLYLTSTLNLGTQCGQSNQSSSGWWASWLQDSIPLERSWTSSYKRRNESHAIQESNWLKTKNSKRCSESSVKLLALKIWERKKSMFIGTRMGMKIKIPTTKKPWLPSKMEGTMVPRSFWLSQWGWRSLRLLSSSW